MKSPVKRIKNKFRYQVLARIIDNRQEIEDEFYEISLKYTTQKCLVYVEVNPGSMN